MVVIVQFNLNFEGISEGISNNQFIGYLEKLLRGAKYLERLEKFYFGLPEIVRWILFLPLSIMGTIIARRALYGKAIRLGAFEFLADKGSTIVAAFVLLYIVNYLIPRFKREALIFLISARTILLLVFIMGFLSDFFSIVTVPQITITNEVLGSSWDYVGMIIQEGTILVVSLKILKQIAPKPFQIEPTENV